MDGRGGCCVARNSSGVYDTSKMDQIMLKFRPIAPKPVSGVRSTSSSISPEDSAGKNVRGKRKYVKQSPGSIIKKRSISPENTTATQPLLKIDRKNSPVSVLLSNHLDLTSSSKQLQSESPICENKMNDNRTVVMPQAVKIVGSCVTVEHVTDTWMDASKMLECTDEERLRSLEMDDTCPGFTSDRQNRVTWTNEEYKKLVGSEMGEGGKMMAWLVIKGNVPVWRNAFSCRVRVQYICRNNSRKEKSSITVPCDVWRMDCGGFAWKLDVKAALFLGPSSFL